MLAARKSSEKSAPEMFDDVPVLQRKWQAAMRPGEKLPAYEDVMLGSLGRLADHIVLLKDGPQGLLLSLAAIRDAEGRPFDFQIVHHNDGAARLLKLPTVELLWQRLGGGRSLLSAGHVVERLLTVVRSDEGDWFEIDSDDRSLKLGVTSATFSR
jgi:hypothetical protein